MCSEQVALILGNTSTSSTVSAYSSSENLPINVLPANQLFSDNLFFSGSILKKKRMVLFSPFPVERRHRKSGRGRELNIPTHISYILYFDFMQGKDIYL